MLVFDEADRLLEDGFVVELRKLEKVENWPEVVLSKNFISF